jgi:hypothetical protein
LLTTIAGVGGPQDVSNWRPEFEGGPATSAVLSGPHITMAVSDRNLHQVFRLDSNGVRTAIAGNGFISGGGDGQLATATALEEVRAVWRLPNGGFVVGTHRGSQVWYIDADGFIRLLLNGNRNGAHFGDGTWFYNPSQARVSEIRAVTLDYDGNLIITEHDGGFVRKVSFPTYY